MKEALSRKSGVVSLLLPLVLVGTLIFLFVGYVVITRKHVGKQCGGFAANLPKYQCPLGLRCKAEGSYPDAGGTCQHIWPLSLITNY